MNNTAKKLISLMLVLCMLTALCSSAFAYKEDDEFDYVVLGASMTNGYGMRYYLDPYYYNYPNELSMNGPGASGYRNNVSGSYPCLVASELKSRGYNVSLHQLAQSSMRVEELRYLLDDSFSGDDYTRWRFYDPEYDSGFWGNGNLDNIKNDYRQSIRDAELITFDLGVNNFGVYLSNQLTSGLFGNDFANIVGEEYASRFYALRRQVHAAAGSVLGDLSSLDTVDSILDTITYALLGFEVNFDASMKCIRELNPDCDIITVAIQNPMAGLDIAVKGIIIPFGEIFGVMVDMANAYMVTLSPYVNEYYCADVRQNGRVTYFFDEIMQYNGNPYSLSQDMIDCFNVYDRKLHANQVVKAAMQNAGIPIDVGVNNNLPVTGEYQELYNTVLYKVYDALAIMLRTAGSCDAMPIDALLNGEDVGQAGDELMSQEIGMPAVLRQYADALIAEEITPSACKADVLTAVPAMTAVENAEATFEEPFEEIVVEEAPVVEDVLQEPIVSETPVAEEIAQEAPLMEAASDTSAELQEESFEMPAVMELPMDIMQMPADEFFDLDDVVINPVDFSDPSDTLDLYSAEPSDSFDLYSAIDELLSSDVRKLAAAFGMRTSIGNTFFTHPNSQGHQEIADSVMRALDMKISSRQALAEAILSLETKAFKLSVKYGPRVLVLIVEKLADALSFDEETSAYINNNIIPSGKDMSDMLAEILELLNINSFDDFDRADLALDELALYLKKNPDALHEHTPIYCEKTSANCTKDGHTAYWRCSVCGMLYEDFECTRELAEEETLIPAAGHNMKKVAAKKATLFAAGNIEYYICKSCGLWYFDQAGTKQIINPLDVVTPKLSIIKSFFG